MPRVEKDPVLDVSKMKVTEVRKAYDILGDAYHRLKDGAFCHHCNRFLNKSSFYQDIHNKSGLTNVCKDCAYDTAVMTDKKNGEKYCTRDSVINALRLLNKPFIESLYEQSAMEAADETTNKTNAYAAYIKNVQSLSQYYGMQYSDSDHLKVDVKTIEDDEETTTTVAALTEELEEQYRKNKKDVVRSIGYDPFANYPIEEDKPILYAQLNSFIDEETKNDGMKMGAVIQIVKKLNQAEKLNDQIDKYINDVKHAADNMGLIDKMTSSSQKLINVANTMAKDNGISVNFNNNKSKGANTLSGKIKKLNEIGLRDAKVNAFDAGTCEGMRQVAEINEAARHKQIGYDENIAQEIKDIKVELVEKMTKERDEAVETARLLLMENKDLKNFLLAKGLVNENFEVIDND